MGKFRRELRYLVFKLKDIDRYLSPREWETLVSIENKIIAARDKERRPQLSTVVVERDWPEFEIVWGMIEARMLGVKNKYEVEIEDIQTELSEQCRLLGMSAERELKLIAEIEAMRKQELVGEVLDVGINGQSYGTTVRLHKPLKSGTKLYLAAGAQTAPSVPDGWREFLGDLVQRVSEAGDHTHWSFHREMVRLAHRAHQMLRRAQGAHAAPSVPEGWQPIETAPKDGTHVLLANKSGTRVADGMYGNYGVWSWPYVMVEPAYWRPMPAAPGAQENNDA